MATTWDDLVDTTIINYDRLCGDFIAKMPDVRLDSRIAIATGIEFSRLAAADAIGTWLSTPRKVFAFMQDVQNENDGLFDEIIENVPEEMAGDVDLIDLDEVDKRNLKSVPPAVLASGQRPCGPVSPNRWPTIWRSRNMSAVVSPRMSTTATARSN